MKHCVKCEFFSEDFVPMGPGGHLQKGYFCSHHENTDPVTGEPIPCNIARREQIFCGHQARHYKEAPPKKTDDEKAKNVIQLT